MKFTYILSVVLVTIMVFGLIKPSSASISNPDLVGEPDEINVTVSSTFKLYVWIKNIDEVNVDSLYMVGLRFYVHWDPNYMDLIGWDNLADDRGWHVYDDGPTGTPGEYKLYADIGPNSGEPTKEDLIWAILEFHCIQEGTSNIFIEDSINETTVWLWDTSNEPFPNVFDEDTIPVNQHPPSVGGIITPTNTLFILWPYLTLVGLVTAVTTAAVVLKKRRKTLSISS